MVIILGVEPTLDQARGVMAVRLSGDVDLASVPQLRSALFDIDQRGHHRIELDLRLVDFIDSSGIGALLGALRRARIAGGDLRIVAAAAPVSTVLGVLGLSTVFGMGTDPDAAPSVEQEK